MSDKPPINYTLTVHEPDDTGHVYIKSSIPGLFLYGKLEDILADVPRVVDILRKCNGDERLPLTTIDTDPGVTK